MPTRFTVGSDMSIREYTKLYIDGAWQMPAVAAAPTEVLGAADGTVVARVPAGSPADVDLAVVAARKAFDGWATTKPLLRAALLNALGVQLAASAEDLADLITIEVGMPRKLAGRVQVGGPLQVLRSYA